MSHLAPPAPFLRSLRHILDHESPTVVTWTPDGGAFEIHDIPAMAQRVLPKYFKHANYSSFQRQLNYFRFRKWTRLQADVCTFSNELFQRDAPELMRRIMRKKSKPAKPTPATRATAPYERRSQTTTRALDPMAYASKTTHFAPQSPLGVADYHPRLGASICYYPLQYTSGVGAFTGALHSAAQFEPHDATATAETSDLAWLDALYPTLDAVQMLDDAPPHNQLLRYE